MENYNPFDDQVSTLDENIDEQKIIPLGKFIFLCIISFGLYQIWWSYKAWKFFKQKEESDIIPAARGFFAVLFAGQLFDKVLDFAREKGYPSDYSPFLLALGYFLAGLSGRFPVPYLFLSFFSFLFFIQPFNAFNYARQHSDDVRVSPEDSFSTSQIVLILLGILFWVITLLGLILPEPVS